jgi:hypothetical protein
MQVYSEWEGGAFRQFDQLVQPVRRTDYVTAGRGLRQHQFVSSIWGWNSVDLRGSVQAYRPGDTYRVSWNKAPSHPTQNWVLPGCSLCRSENVPVFAMWTRGDSDPTHYGSGRTWTSTSLWRDGTQVFDPVDFLVERPAVYRIEQVGESDEGPEHTLAVRTRTAWTFVSRAPTRLEIEDCGEVVPSANVCAALPLILLGYDVPLDLLNRAPAGRAIELEVRTSRSVDYRGPGDIAGMRVKVSYDDGATWQSVDVRRSGNGEFDVRVVHPRLDRTNGFVSLQVSVWDHRGNRTDQTIERAYALK